jgi:cell division protein FtsB
MEGPMPSNVPPATAEDKLNWEVEKLRREVRNLNRTFLTAIILAIAAAVTTGYNVVKALTDLSEFQKQQGDLKKEIAELSQEREVATAQLSNFRKEVDDLRNDTTLSLEQKLERLPTIQPALQYGAPEQTNHTSLPARVYLQYLDEEKEYVDKVVSQLEQANYKVKPLGVASTSRTRVPTVAYYYEEDEPQARELIKLLQQIGVSKIKPEPVKLQGSARPRHFDVWLPRADR